MPQIVHAIDDNRGIFKKWLFDPLTEKVQTLMLKKTDKNFQLLLHAFDKLHMLKSNVNQLYKVEIKLRNDAAEFVKVMENLTEDLQYSSMLGDDVDQMLENEATTQI